MLYILIVSIAMVIIITCSILVALLFKTFSILYAVVMPIAVLAYVILFYAVISFLFRLIIPQKLFKYDNKIFKVKRKEVDFYEKLKIKKWKDRLPEAGKTGGFVKKNLISIETTYLKKFLYETCYAEFLHILSAIFGFTAIIVFPIRDYMYVLPIVLINFLLHIPLAIVQRYNRYRLAIVYERKLKNESNLQPQTI